MKHSDDIFLLIKSMTKTEKRYFKLFASFHSGEKKYIQLFDAIEHQKEYDEKKIKEIFKKEQFVVQFPVAKNYLYKLILKSLGMYNRGKSVNSDIRELLEYTEVFRKKGLYKQAANQIEKAKALAYRYEKYSALPLIMHWESALMRHQRSSYDKIKNFPKQFLEVLEKLKNTNDYQQINIQMWALYGEIGISRTKKEMQQFDQLYKQALMKDESRAETIEAKWCFYNTKVSYYRAIQIPEKAYPWGKKLVAIMESFPGYVEEEIDRYVSSLGNFILILMEMKKTDECLSTIKKLKELTEHKSLISHKNLLARIFINADLQELDLYIVTGDFQKGENLIPKIEEGLKKYDLELSEYTKTTFYYLISNVYISIGKYKKALPWINKVLDRADVRPDYQPMARILNIIIHYELENRDLLEYIIKSSHRFLNKNEKLFNFEQLLLNHFRKIAGLYDQEELLGNYKKLLKDLQLLIKDPLEKQVLLYFDIISWVESKIEGKSMEEIVKAKIKK